MLIEFVVMCGFSCSLMLHDIAWNVSVQEISRER